MSGRRVALITGAAGFLGKQLLAALVQQVAPGVSFDEVRLLDLPGAWTPDAVEQVQGLATPACRVQVGNSPTHRRLGCAFN
jgi:nucleoside-diphosphate-sugar epimerase